MEKRIAVLGGSTTNDIISMLELFLLNCGIQPAFYQSEYAQYWQDAMFDNPELESFQPDLIFIHTTSRNISEAPLPLSASEQEVRDALERQFSHFSQMWERLHEVYHCPLSRTTLNCRPLGSWETGMPGTVTAWSGLSRN
ncbi:MAG: hypothetical protein ACLR5S_09595 [Ruminococcus sp.]